MRPRSGARKDLRVMTTIELNVINAAKSVLTSDDDGTLAGAQRYMQAYNRLTRAVLLLNATEERDRLERDRLRKARSRAGTRSAMK